jgi:hypothetical protein
MSPRPTAIVVSLFLGASLALLAVFAVLELDLVQQPSVRTNDADEQIEERLSSIETRLRQLQLELQAIPSRIDGSDGSDRRLPADEAAPSSSSRELAELRSAIEALRRDLAAAPHASPDEVRELVQRPQDLSKLLEIVGDPADANFDSDGASQRLRETHLLWTVPQLVEAYGLPLELGGSESLIYEYGPPGSELHFRFGFRGGYVVFADFDS